MHIKDTFFNKSHFTSPFTMPDKELSTAQKAVSVALPVFLGLFVAGAGIIAFYLINAAMKAKKLKSKQTEEIDKISKQNLGGTKETTEILDDTTELNGKMANNFSEAPFNRLSNNCQNGDTIVIKSGSISPPQSESIKNANTEIIDNKTTQKNLNPEQEKIIEEFTSQMVEALGGVDKVLSFPIIENWNGVINPEDLTAPIMRGYQRNGTPFLLFCYLKRFEYKNDEQLFSEYKVDGEYLGRIKKNSWERAPSYDSELNLRSVNSIADGSLGTQYMLNKISRLMKGEALGIVEKFPGVYAFKPKDKTSYSPNNAYLKGEELDAYMDVDTIFYERQPEEGTTEIYLYDPRISKEENISALLKKFPAMKARLYAFR